MKNVKKVAPRADAQGYIPDEAGNGWQKMLLATLAILVGTVIAAVYLPVWQPGLVSSLIGDKPKVYWFLSRGSGLVSFWLLWLSMAFGVIITNRMARLWPGGPTAFDIHEYASLLGLAFITFHAFILLGDQFMKFKVSQILIPFTTTNFHPLWVGLGQIAFYLWIPVTLTFYIRGKIGMKSWRWIHFLSYLVFLMGMVHGLAAGTDSGAPWAVWMYWGAAISLLFLFIYRVMVKLIPQTA